ncbi:MAG: hypothetical protein CSB33_01090 [Desulfobacterales bacterium]|nr:MAG: hypothetical protein CSB33_01090 [Desulfobacterales bacterium]
MHELVLKGVTKVFGGKVKALNDVTLEVRKGELLVLLGPSGCGKTTLLRQVAGLEKPDAGEILFKGENIAKVPPPQRPFALVFQNYALYPHLSVRENLTYRLRVQKMARPEIDRRLEETVDLLHLGRHQLGRKPAELSGGERQRVALGKAIMHKPEVFLLDEPLSNLDQKLRVSLRSELKRIQRTLQATMILVTHDQNEAMTLGDRIAILSRGHLEQTGRPRDLYANPESAFVAAFLASPPMNLIKGRLEKNNGGWVFREAEDGQLTIPLDLFQGNFPEEYHHREVLLGIRPESVLTTSPPKEDSYQCRLKVMEVEFLGPMLYLHLDSGAHRICSLADRNTDMVPGQSITIHPDLCALFFFDPVNGNRIH